MVNRKLGIAVLLVLFIMPMVLATTTTINVKTLAEHDVQLKILDPHPSEGEGNLLEYFKETTDETGLASFESHASKSVINLLVIVEKAGVRKKINDKTIHKFDNKPTGATISLDVKETASVPAVPETNETNETEETMGISGNEIDVNVEIAEELETETTTEKVEEEKEKGKITGAIIDGGKAIVTSKITYYIIGGIFVLGVLFFLVFIGRKKLRGKGHYIDFKIRDGEKSEEDREREKREREIARAEKKVEEAKEELDNVKHRKTRLQEVRARLERDKRELERLEGD